MAHNWPVWGHDWAVDYLRKGMAHGRVRHAYLITGTESVGKSTLAHSFALALNCTHPDEDARPCLECRSCKLLLSGNHPDMVYSETDDSTGALKIEQIRAVTSRLAMKPYEARYRIAIFRDFDRAQPRAQDALLKTLEEPPGHAGLILIAPDTESILPTIISRCQRVHLRPVPVDTIRAVLMERYGVEEEQATLLARLSGGRIGWAIAALQNPDSLAHRDAALDMLEDVLRKNRAERFALAESLGRDKLALYPLLELWQSYWRDVLLAAESSPVKPSNVDRTVAIEQLVYNVTSDEALAALRATETMRDQLKYNINLRLALEVMFLDYPGLR